MFNEFLMSFCTNSNGYVYISKGNVDVCDELDLRKGMEESMTFGTFETN